MNYYTGVGSRSTPEDVLAYCESLAAELAADGWVLRSGHAQGADRAFERGAGGRSEIYLPWKGFGQVAYNSDPGAPVHGTVLEDREAWFANYASLQRLGLRGEDTAAAKLLHGRNVAQLAGLGPRSPRSRFVVCWCPILNGAPRGGTATAVRLARAWGIPTFNLWRDAARAQLLRWLANHPAPPAGED